MWENEIGKQVVDAAISVHRGLGPGLLESVYEVALAYELEKRGFQVDRQVAIDFEYDGQLFREGFRADLIVESRVIVELKCVESLTPAYKKQVLTFELKKKLLLT